LPTRRVNVKKSDLKNIIAFLIVSILLIGCGVKGTGSYQPPALPLKVMVDTEGNISFEIQQEIEYPTPLGTFAVGVVVDPIDYFEKEATLTIRLNDEDYFYDLHGNDFVVNFESGYYEKVELTKRGNDILLELRKKQSAIESEYSGNFFTLNLSTFAP